MRDALHFLGAGDAERATAQVRGRPANPARFSDSGMPIGPARLRDAGFQRDVEPIFDELYARIHGSVRLDQAFFTLLDRTHARLTPVIRAEQARVQALWRAARSGRSRPRAREQKAAARLRERTSPSPRLRPRGDRAYP